MGSGLWSGDGGWGVVETGAAAAGTAAGAKAGEVGWREGVDKYIGTMRIN